jgi:hypothetical protein
VLNVRSSRAINQMKADAKVPMGLEKVAAFPRQRLRHFQK